MTASAKKDLLLRLNQLEHKLAIRSKWPYVLIVGERIDRERREALAEGERIVLDCVSVFLPGRACFGLASASRWFRRWHVGFRQNAPRASLQAGCLAKFDHQTQNLGSLR